MKTVLLIMLLSVLSFPLSVKMEVRHADSTIREWWSASVIIKNNSTKQITIRGFSQLQGSQKIKVGSDCPGIRLYYKRDSIIVPAKTVTKKVFASVVTKESTQENLQKRTSITDVSVLGENGTKYLNTDKSTKDYYRDSLFCGWSLNVPIPYWKDGSGYTDTLIFTDSLPTTLERKDTQKQITYKDMRNFNVLGQRIRSNHAQQIIIRKNGRKLNLK